MHRCWLGEIDPLTVDDTITLSPEESAHVSRVLRMKPGGRVQLIAAERLYEGELLSLNGKAATVRVLAALPSPEAAVRVALVQGLPKNGKMELIVQKATELGAWDVFPVAMERCVSRPDKAEAERKRESWARVAREAAKQSGRAHVPTVRPVQKLAETIEMLAAEGYEGVFIAWEEEGEHRLSGALAAFLAERTELRAVALVVGPEGGIEPSEVAALRALGARCVTLGRRILRTETAGFCALTITMSALGEM